MSENLYSGHKNEAVLDYVLKRRSCPLKTMGDEGPSQDETALILQAGGRVPDHGKLFPWRFVVFSGAARKEFGQEVLKKAWASEDPQAAPAKLELEAERFLRAPLIIAVISTPKEAKHPEWEQQLSTGAACYNLCLAAHALGFGANWITEWIAYNKVVHDALGMKAQDRIAGLIYIGRVTDQPEERPRPEMKDIVTYWG